MCEAGTCYAYKSAEGGWRIADSRVSLDSVVVSFQEGKSPEAIAAEFPSLTFEQVHGALAFCLRNQAEIDEYLSCQDSNWRQVAARSISQNGPLLDRLRKSTRSDAEE
jgi:uncharacterized protein (DUF433 family)